MHQRLVGGPQGPGPWGTAISRRCVKKSREIYILNSRKTKERKGKALSFTSVKESGVEDINSPRYSRLKKSTGFPTVHFSYTVRTQALKARVDDD